VSVVILWPRNYQFKKELSKIFLGEGSVNPKESFCSTSPGTPNWGGGKKQSFGKKNSSPEDLALPH
jgi:hypothetical protein